MRKQLAIGLSVLALTSMGGASEDELLLKQDVHHNTAHLVETSLNQAFEPKSGASLSADLPNRFSYQTASVQFIVNQNKLSFDSVDFEDNTKEKCQKLGYYLTECTGAGVTRWKAGICPYNPEYFKECCLNAYKYTASECTSPRTISTESCGGKYKCSCSTTTYPYTSSNCASPKVLGGETCTLNETTNYSQCSCPANYSQTCSGSNQQGSGTGCSEDGVTYYMSCQCGSGYNLTCSDLGPATPSDYCLKDGIKYYKNCKTCENKCTLSKCPDENICETEACSQKYCAIGCAINYTDWCTKPETNCETLGYTQTEADCSGVNMVKCPYDSTKVACFISNSSSSTPTPTPQVIRVGDILWENGEVGTTTPDGPYNKPLGVVFDAENRLAVALEDANGGSTMNWSDDPVAKPCYEESVGYPLENQTAGQQNTNQIMSSCGSSSNVVNAAKSYYPACNSGLSLCQHGAWFLPSLKELKTIYDNKAVLNEAISVGLGGDKLSEDFYWSSTGNNSLGAWIFRMSDGYYQTYGRTYPGRVRAVIAF